MRDSNNETDAQATASTEADTVRARLATVFDAEHGAGVQLRIDGETASEYEHTMTLREFTLLQQEVAVVAGELERSGRHVCPECGVDLCGVEQGWRHRGWHAAGHTGRRAASGVYERRGGGVDGGGEGTLARLRALREGIDDIAWHVGEGSANQDPHTVKILEQLPRLLSVLASELADQAALIASMTTWPRGRTARGDTEGKRDG